MNIVLGSDHGGFTLKEQVKQYLLDLGHNVVDVGCDSEESVDYPAYAKAAAKKVVSGECEKGVVVCGTGIGISIAANKVKGIRCALVSEPLSAKLTASHNNTNMLALGGRIIGIEMAKDIVRTWLETPFEGGRHEGRISQIEG